MQVKHDFQNDTCGNYDKFQMSNEDMVPWSACFSSHEFNLICPTVSLLCCWQLLIARFHLNFTYCSLLITF